MQRSFHATVKPFIGGLNTELSQVEETPQYTADELNCRTYPDGSRGRRYGMGIEQFGTTLYRDDNKIYSVYYWSNAHKNNVDLLVTQVGNSLVFKRANRPFSSQNNFATVDLTPYIIDTEGMSFENDYQIIKENLPMTAGSDVHSTVMFGGGMAFKKRLKSSKELCEEILRGTDYILTNGDRYYDHKGNVIG